MKENLPSKVKIYDPFWMPRLEVDAEIAILHQWQMLEDNGCIDNFRITAGEIDGFREGWFFADSDAYKWLEAACRINAVRPNAKLKKHMDDFISLVGRSQMTDGYIFTYNQLHFPHQRWVNLMIEHELYCHGHLIEAGVSHYESTGEKSAIDLARRAADLLVKEFLIAPNNRTSGHEEIEIALIRLYNVTGTTAYLDLASRFIERRGKMHAFGASILLQNASMIFRMRMAQKKRESFLTNNPGYLYKKLPPENYARKNLSVRLRWLFSCLTGRFFQMHAPIRNQTVPVGHAVRFAYLQTAIAMLYRHKKDQTLLPSLQISWKRLVTRRMYITGGIGSLPMIEGFGNDFELDPEFAYAETCAALGIMFWNWEMVLISNEACYSDLFEWQLFNAAAVGMGLGGKSYLYNNPLTCSGGVSRKAWFMVPCCPSNLSRTFASLGKYIFSFQPNVLFIHQYIGCQVDMDLGIPVKINLQSSLPWEGKVRITFEMEKDIELLLHLRIPSWTEKSNISINGNVIPNQNLNPSINREATPSASGFNPYLAWFAPIRRVWSPGDILELEFETPIKLRRASPFLKSHQGKTAITRGPLVYCLENVDNPELDIFSSCLDPGSISTSFLPSLLGGTQIITGKSKDGKELQFIPYFLWANRGKSQMTVWINT